MNISKLFDMQRVLDERIIKEHGLEGKDLLQERILALNVELAELAQETRCFKFWSKNQQPSDRVLDELVDVLHFVLSIGIETGMELYFCRIPEFRLKRKTISFNRLFYTINEFQMCREEENYYRLTESLLILVDVLNFKWEQVEEAYMKKNAENHARQDRGY